MGATISHDVTMGKWDSPVGGPAHRRRGRAVLFSGLFSLVVTAVPATDARATTGLEEVLEILVADSSRFGSFYPCPTLDGRVCDYPDAVAISVIDLDTGESASVNGDILMRMASSAKPVWVAAGVYDLGIAAIEPYAAPIFVESSNHYAAAVIDLIGPLCNSGVDRLNTIVATDFGIADLAINSWYGCRSALLTNPSYGTNRISTNGLAAFWAELARGELLDPAETTTVLTWGRLERNHWHDLITARQPPGTTIAYKAGWMSSSEGSRMVGGTITTPLGRHFALAIAVRAYSGSFGTGAREWPAYASCVVAYAVMGLTHECDIAGDPPVTPIDTRSPSVALARRYAGSDRFATSVAISQATFTSEVETVFVATGYNYPDALAAGAVAGRSGAPLLLVRPDHVPSRVLAELARLSPSRIMIVGGTSVVSVAVEAKLATLAPVTRLGGVDRFETATLIAAEHYPDGASTVFLTTGYDWPLALIAAPVASAAGGPVLLTPPDALPDVVRHTIAALAPGRVVIIGGETAVSAAVEAELATVVGVVERIDAGSASATAALLAAGFPDTATVFVATDALFADSLSGAAAAANLGIPLLFTARSGVPDATLAALAAVAPVDVIVLGGTAAVSDVVAALLASAAD